MIVLYPKSEFNNSITDFRKVDENFEQEYNVASTLGFDIVLFDFNHFKKYKDVITDKNYSRFSTPISAIYRGWMMSIEDYSIFYTELSKMNIILKTNIAQYLIGHYFPYTYPYIKDYTPHITYISKEDFDTIKPKELKSLTNTLSSDFFIKDYVKSAKGKDNKIEIIPSDITPNKLYKKCKEFIKYRNTYGDYWGGLVFKQCLTNIKKYGDDINECRVFVYNNKVVSIESNGILKDMKLPDYGFCTNMVRLCNIPSSFYTMDYIEVAGFVTQFTGDWALTEVGDAQVSGLASGNTNPITLYGKLI